MNEKQKEEYLVKRGLLERKKELTIEDLKKDLGL